MSRRHPASLLALLCLLLSQLCFGNPLSTGEMEMKVWDAGDEAPTWHLTLAGDKAQAHGHEYVLKIANECWNWVSKQPKAFGKYGTAAVVVAALYDQKAGLIHVSTIPRGSRLIQMAELKDKAPSWKAAAKAYVSKTGMYCAEDGALFNAETAGAAITNDTDQSFMVAWGSFRPSDTSRAWIPCANKRERILYIPGCQTTLNNLGILWKERDLPFTWPSTPEAIEGDESAGAEPDLDPQEVAAAIGAIQQGDFPHKKRDISERKPENRVDDGHSTFTTLRRSQAVMPRSDSTPASGATPDPSWPAYTGTVAFPTKETDITTIASTWFQSSTTSSPTVTSPPASRIPCKFLPQDPDQGRDDAGCVCTVSGKTSTWPSLALTGTQTFGPDGYCGYTAAPGTSKTITTQVNSWTSNCQACTLTGGIADTPSCTTVSGCTPTQAVPTFAAWVANRKLSIGDAQANDNGTSLAKNMFKQLSSFCSGDRKSCDTGKNAEMPGVRTIVNGGEEPLKPQMSWENAVFSDMSTLQQMLSAGLSSWTAASKKMCEETDYTADEPETGSGCQDGPLPMIRRSDNSTFLVTPHTVRRVEKRECPDCIQEPAQCHYKAWICDAPDLITVVRSDGKGNPYANEINIRVDYGKEDGFNEFLCEMIVEGLTTTAMALAPELLPEEEAEQASFEALCGELGSLADEGN